MRSSPRPVARPALSAWRRARAMAAVLVIASPAFAAAQPQGAGGEAGAYCAVSGMRIGSIAIERLDVFDLRSSGLVGVIERSANGLHVQTRERVIRRYLLFREGDLCDDEALGQTERNLRATGLFQRVVVLVSAPRNGVVDVTVRARDAWSLRVNGDYGHVGGVPTWEAGISETNVAGSGAGIGLGYRSRFEADVTTAWFADQRFLGQEERLALQVDRRSDGRTSAASVTRPFYSLESRWGHEFAFADTRDHLRLYENGEVSDDYRRRAVEAIAGLAARVASPSASSAVRLAAGVRYSAREYGEPDGGGSDDELPPPTRRLAGPYVNLEYVEHRFLKRTGLFVPGRDTDVNLGTRVGMSAFYSLPIARLETSARVTIGGWVSRGWLLRDRGIVVASLAGSGAFGGREDSRGDVTGTVRAWWQASPTHVRAGLLETRWLANPDRAGRLYLGGSPGLRGYREYAFSGTKSILFIAEERKFFGWTLARLFQFGVAGFAEGGAIGGDPMDGRAWRGAANVGAGLRVAQLRTSSSAALRVDIAFPLVPAPDGRRGPQLVIGYRGDY